MPVRAPSATRSTARLLVGLCLAVAVLVCWLTLGEAPAWSASCGSEGPLRAARAATEPVITFPQERDRIADRTPTITGECAPPGATGTVRLAGQSLTAVADADGDWSATAAALPFGPVTVGAEWTGGDNVFAADPVDFTVIPGPLRVDAPGNGSTTTDRRPLIDGAGAEPGALVSVGVDGREWTTTADTAGRWSLRPGVDLGLGSQLIMVRQIIGGTESDPVRLTVVVAEPGVSPGPTPSGPTPSGPTPPPSPPTPPEPRRPAAASPTPTGPRTGGPGPTPAGTEGSGSGGSGRTTPAGHERTRGDLNRAASPDEGPAGVGAPTSADQPTTVPASPTGTATGPPGPSRAPGDDLLPMRLTLAPGIVVPGQVAAFVGSFGPAPGSGRARVLISGTLNRGVSYRSVAATQGGRCAVTTLQFDCDLELATGRPAIVSIRLVADQLAAPPYVRQQLSVQTTSGSTGAATTRAPTRNTMTRTTPTGPTAVSGLAAAISAGPGLVVVLFALYLLALAAAEHERRRPGRRSRPNQPERGPR